MHSRVTGFARMIVTPAIVLEFVVLEAKPIESIMVHFVILNNVKDPVQFFSHTQPPCIPSP